MRPGLVTLRPQTLNQAMHSPAARRDTGQVAVPARGNPFVVRSQVGENRSRTGPVSCTPTSTKMVLDNKGIKNNDSVASMYNRLHQGRDPREVGTNPRQAVNNLNSSILPPGHHAQFNTKVPDVKQTGPYVANLQTSPKMGHSVVVTDENRRANRVTMADPWTGRMITDTDADFRQKFTSAVTIQ